MLINNGNSETDKVMMEKNRMGLLTPPGVGIMKTPIRILKSPNFMEEKNLCLSVIIVLL